MTRQDYYNIITKVFRYNEVTFHDQEFTLNSGHRTKKGTDLPYELCIILSRFCILEKYSGNFQTGEQHYLLNKTTLSEILAKDTFSDIIPEFLIETVLPIYRDKILDEVLGD
jgi:hypothetical protein